MDPLWRFRVPCACPTHTLGEVPHACRARAPYLPLRVPYAFLVLPCRPLVPLGPDWRSLHLLECFRVPCACPVHVLRTRALRVPDICPMRAARVPYAGPAHDPRVPYACPTHAPLRVAYVCPARGLCVCSGFSTPTRVLAIRVRLSLIHISEPTRPY